MARETWVQSQVESYQRLKKWYLMPPCLTLSIIRYGSRVKWSNPGKGVAPSPTPWCSKLSKRELFGSPSTMVANFTYYGCLIAFLLSFLTLSVNFIHLLFISFSIPQDIQYIYIYIYTHTHNYVCLYFYSTTPAFHLNSSKIRTMFIFIVITNVYAIIFIWRSWRVSEVKSSFFFSFFLFYKFYEKEKDSSENLINIFYMQFTIKNASVLWKREASL